MAAKKYYWLKLKEDFFDDDTIEWIEEQPNGKEHCLFYLKLCLKSLKTNGILIRNVGQMLIPYDVEKLAEVTKTAPDTVRVAMETFKRTGLVQILENGEIYVSQLKNMVGSETDKAQLMRNKREREKLEGGNNVTKLLPNCYTEIENRDRDKDIELRERDREIEHIDYQRIANMYNEICISFPTIRALSESRKKAIKARLHSGYTYEDFETLFKMAESSDFLKGKNKKDWSASFDWLIKDANFAKVLEGNYSNKKKVATIENTTDNPFLKAAMEMDDND